MAFSNVTLTGNFGSGAVGSLTFTLTQPMSNGDVVAAPVPLVVALTGGTFSQAFPANGDAATVPQGVQWGVTEVITGAPARDYNISIPPIVIETNGSILSSDTDQVQLSSALATPAMVGQSIAATGIPANTIITAVTVGNPINDPLNPAPALPLNSVTISNPATPGTALTVTIGTTIDLSQLMPGTVSWN